MTCVSLLLAAALSLGGVTGEDLRARAFFDANNAKVGDPLVLTIDFLGSADFADLHPPALSRAIDKRDWKLDAASAKTDTFRGAKRLTWRVRPRREGVLWFPAISFTYADRTGGVRTVTANAIPVHAKPGADVVVEEMGRDETEMPEPEPLMRNPPELKTLSPDAQYAWRKACAKPTADAFVPFDFPAGRLNEARCAVLAGDWKRATKIYTRLEWTTGQTPAIEKGLLAALAVRYSNPLVELPVWRQVGRPLLKYDWRGRVGWVAGSLAAVVLVFLLLGKLVRVLACAALALLLVLPQTARAEDPFAAMERMMQQQQQRMRAMTQSMGMGSSFFSFGGREEPMPQIQVRTCPDRKNPTVGENFNFIVELEAPKSVSIGQISLDPSEKFGLQVAGRVANLADGTSANASNIVKRLLVPVRYDVPMKGKMSFRVSGMLTSRGSHGGRGSFSFSFSRNFTAESAPCAFEIRPLPTANQPKDFAGIVASRLRFTEAIDLPAPESNDVVCVTYRLDWSGGYVPADWMPDGAAFEMDRFDGENGFEHAITWRRFVVADGIPATPTVSFSWYEPRSKKYRKAGAGGSRLRYRPAEK